MMEQNYTGIIKTDNVWSSIVEPDSDHQDEHSSDTDDRHDNQICEATKTDGNPCQGIKYKDKPYCYSHLKSRPRGRPPTTTLPAAVTGQPAASGCATHYVEPAVVSSETTTIGTGAGAGGCASHYGCATHYVDQQVQQQVQNEPCPLFQKLSQRLKEKLEGLDNEMKTLLKMLL